jgi:TRAP-type C4-dicarboxylate transport system permease small subunit
MKLQDKVTKIASRTESGVHSTNTIMAYVSAVALFGMMMLTVADVFGRYVLSNPIKGTWELVGFMLVAAGGWGMGYCQIRKGHIRVDFLLSRFPEKIRAVLTILANFLGLVAFSLLCWRCVLYAQYYLSIKTGNATDTLHIPLYPFVLVLAVGAGMLALVILFDLIHSIAKVKGK